MSNIYPVTLERLLADGFTRKLAMAYLAALEEDNSNPLIDPQLCRWAHERGFLAEVAGTLGLNDDNYHMYMSNYEWYKIWPLNGWMRIWINDKMTLKYMLHGTEYSNLMPEYYFYMSQGGLRELVDNPYPGRQEVNTLIQVLEDKGALAAKPNNGALAAGFYALKYKEGHYFVNDREVSRQSVVDLVLGKVNYIYTEFLQPAYPFSKVDKNIHTIRVLVMNPEGNNPQILDASTIRFSTSGKSGGNLVHFTPETPQGLYNMYSHVNIRTGEVDRTRLCGLTSSEETEVHPQTGVSLKLAIADFDLFKQKLLGVAKFLFGTEWIGFDACISTKGIKIMEINSHAGCHSAQIFTPLYSDPKVRDYLKGRLAAIDAMSPEEKMQRAAVLR